MYEYVTKLVTKNIIGTSIVRKRQRRFHALKKRKWGCQIGIRETTDEFIDLFTEVFTKTERTGAPLRVSPVHRRNCCNILIYE